MNKRRVQAWHKASVTRMRQQIKETLAKEFPAFIKLSLVKMSLQEKLESLKLLDGEVVELIKDKTLAE